MPGERRANSFSILRNELSALRRSCEPRGAAAKALNASLSRPCNSAVLRDAASNRVTSFIVFSFSSRRPRTTQGLSAPHTSSAQRRPDGSGWLLETGKDGCTRNAACRFEAVSCGMDGGANGHCSMSNKMRSRTPQGRAGAANSILPPRRNAFREKRRRTPASRIARLALGSPRVFQTGAPDFPFVRVACRETPKSLAEGGSSFNVLPAPKNRVGHDV